jgi:hypothetical protein
MEGGGFPYEALREEIRGMGGAVPMPPSPEASRIEVMRGLWEEAGLEKVETREIVVERTFGDFEDYWETVLGGPSVVGALKTMGAEDIAVLRSRMRARLVADGMGRITCSGRANAVKGFVRG